MNESNKSVPEQGKHRRSPAKSHRHRQKFTKKMGRNKHAFQSTSANMNTGHTQESLESFKHVVVKRLIAVLSEHVSI